MTPKRIQLSRRKGFRLPLNAKSVARPSKWGNPFVIWRVECSMGGMCWTVTDGRIRVPHISSKREAATHAIGLYALHTGPLGCYEFDAGAVEQLRGYDLACWCPLDMPCHADVLIDLLSQGEA